ncbi:hypothetical protein EYF80_018386 [Liparis tanakae]|uniref:Uncharacterized protein n=1 Tax=Liparis tanakae TaxID=230148 RepID=A0A4Z2I0F0_9TELE|nr:hypothetical protein EYF80_018386 [Liparis tanakae]
MALSLGKSKTGREALVPAEVKGNVKTPVTAVLTQHNIPTGDGELSTWQQPLLLTNTDTPMLEAQVLLLGPLVTRENQN